MTYTVCDLNTQNIFEISEPQWQKNCEDKTILLRYLAIPVKEDKEKLWLAIDDLNNLTAYEIFSFIAHKEIEPILISTEELKYLLNEL